MYRCFIHVKDMYLFSSSYAIPAITRTGHALWNIGELSPEKENVCVRGAEKCIRTSSLPWRIRIHCDLE